jgi:hypothetical protein
MNFITLVEAKKQLNIEQTFIEDDNYISSLIEVAFLTIKNACNNQTWSDNSGYTTDYTSFADTIVTGTTIPLPIKWATLLLLADMYNVRESNTFVQSYTNKTVDLLIYPYINYQKTIEITE